MFYGRKLLLLSLLQPKGRLLGDQGRGEDPFRKKLAEAGPPGKRPREAEAGNRLSIHQKHFINSLKSTLFLCWTGAGVPGSAEALPAASERLAAPFPYRYRLKKRAFPIMESSLSAY
ncbi:MAG: hypothetical protein EA344_00105 [Alkalicoccus sp.]|uniref:Uncharacterized protein n=1 Tax=Alkalicoccus sp. TaxID=2005376 RepID=A0A651DLR5_9BACI|nr:MAG: hypothetical protein EA344_00105 [Alkalicoccus sp.]